MDLLNYLMTLLVTAVVVSVGNVSTMLTASGVGSFVAKLLKHCVNMVKMMHYD